MSVIDFLKTKRRGLIICFITGFIIFLFYRICSSTESVNIGSEVTSSQLVMSFVSNEEKANDIFKDKLIIVEGVIKEVNFINNRNTVVLYGNGEFSSVLCDMELTQKEEVGNLKSNQKIKLKGICKGFLKDVILLNCTLIKTTLNE